jgi:hypothetical protein
MGGETAWNMYSFDNNKEYCITLHLVGYTSHILTMHGPMNIKNEKNILTTCSFHEICAKNT